MDNFALKFLFNFEHVTYYSVVLGEDFNGISIYEDFVNRFTIEEKEKLQHIIVWLTRIGQIHGARPNLFRSETLASALPPVGIDFEPTYQEGDENVANPLRLYCHVLNRHVVILFSGDIKTAKVAQDCPNVKKHFILANKLAKAIDDCIKNKEIEWDDDYRDILFDDENFIIENENFS